MNDPQPENGYTRIANELLDAIVRAPFSKRELLIVLAVARKTYGYNKKTDDMTMTQLAECTGLDRAHVSRTVAELTAKNVLLNQHGNYGKVLGISKNYRNWKFTERAETAQCQKSTRADLATAPCQNGNRAVPKQQIHDAKRAHTKDNPKRQLQKTTTKGCAAPSVTGATWAAYAASYQGRYSVPPTRNAKVNGQLTQLVARLGADDAPAVAAFYVQHNGAWYVKRGHSVDALLSDAEKLRTEWATQTQITDTAARRADATQAQGDVWRALIAEAESHG